MRQGDIRNGKNLVRLIKEMGVDCMTWCTDPLENQEVFGVSSHTQTIEREDIFVALDGQTAKGSFFFEDAIERGARAIVTHAREVNASLCALCLSRGVSLLACASPRDILVSLVHIFYPLKPSCLVAITGTNGKSSTTHFIFQFWRLQGLRAASLGTLGVNGCDIPFPIPSLTTPDFASFFKILHFCASQGVTHFVFEASSHALSQGRLLDLLVDAVVFTNLTRDHIDYHKTMEQYFEAKLLLLQHTKPKAVVVVNREGFEDKFFHRLEAGARERHCSLLTYGVQGEDVTLVDYVPKLFEQNFRVKIRGEHIDVRTHIVGSFQALNLLAAASVLLHLDPTRDLAPRTIFDLFSKLQAVKGRLECVASLAWQHSAIYVDYAHTPEALKEALFALRSHTKNRLGVVFGCGGGRDIGKRSLMGAVAQEYADFVIITDDNPRSEDPEQIRAMILEACPGGLEVPDRAQAIERGIELLSEGDSLLVAGKGHEITQKIGQAVLPFSDQDVVRYVVAQKTPTPDSPLWLVGDLVHALQVEDVCVSTRTIHSVSIDTRTLKKGALFIALKGRWHDGNAFVPEAFARGASWALVDDEETARRYPPSILVPDTKQALRAMSVFRRAQTDACIVGITGSVGKTTLRSWLQSILYHFDKKTHGSTLSYNNEIGLPLSIANIPRSTSYGVFEMGMNKMGEIGKLSSLLRPHVAVITAVEVAHLALTGSLEAIARAKSEIFEGCAPESIAVLGLSPEHPYFDLVFQRAQKACARVICVGQHPRCDIRLASSSWSETGMHLVIRDFRGALVECDTSVLGEHIIHQALLIVGCLEALGIQVTSKLLEPMKTLELPSGRGQILRVYAKSGPITIFDGSYNASPASMRVSLKLLGQYVALRQQGRPIAVLADMLELGPQGEDFHNALLEDLVHVPVSKVFLCGSLMHTLYKRLKGVMPVVWVEMPHQLEAPLLKELKGGDVVLFKGSLGSGLHAFLKNFLENFKYI